MCMFFNVSDAETWVHTHTCRMYRQTHTYRLAHTKRNKSIARRHAYPKKEHIHTKTFKSDFAVCNAVVVAVIAAAAVFLLFWLFLLGFCFVFVCNAVWQVTYLLDGKYTYIHVCAYRHVYAYICMYIPVGCRVILLIFMHLLTILCTQANKQASKQYTSYSINASLCKTFCHIHVYSLIYSNILDGYIY